MKSKRNQEAFDRAKQTQQVMETLAAMEKINLYFFDESGFSTVPLIPYAWQPQGETREMPSFPGKRLNVLGFMSKNQKSYFQMIEGNMNTQSVVAAFTLAYATEYASHNKPCIIILDNASFHTSHAFQQQFDKWGARGVVLHFLPPYSPELNLIEILWRKIKYEWLPLSWYLSYSHLKNSVISILEGFGNEYQITFV